MDRNSFGEILSKKLWDLGYQVLPALQHFQGSVVRELAKQVKGYHGKATIYGLGSVSAYTVFKLIEPGPTHDLVTGRLVIRYSGEVIHTGKVPYSVLEACKVQTLQAMRLGTHVLNLQGELVNCPGGQFMACPLCGRVLYAGTGYLYCPEHSVLAYTMAGKPDLEETCKLLLST